jgi:hypothetical protein
MVQLVSGIEWVKRMSDIKSNLRYKQLSKIVFNQEKNLVSNVWQLPQLHQLHQLQLKNNKLRILMLQLRRVEKIIVKQKILRLLILLKANQIQQ